MGLSLDGGVCPDQATSLPAVVTLIVGEIGLDSSNISAAFCPNGLLEFA